MKKFVPHFTHIYGKFKTIFTLNTNYRKIYMVFTQQQNGRKAEDDDIDIKKKLGSVNKGNN